eukprot:TRINITY_DN3430_c0_g1_i1.p2 TRINITY_DN3430_c0_g1~~TRINITY_DN3430_c0_g1_i1.p2  ORF type:complete len:136 (-),score=24.11 TRINITY_DN3430_c0_g1_i1:280-687(-)
MKKAILSRRETFSSSHRLHSRSLSEQENKEIFGKCNNPNGHGHNYVLEVMLYGPIDPVTGMVMNLSDLKKILQDEVLDVLDHKNLDLDVSGFQDKPSTTENLAVWIWEKLAKKVPLLHEVKIHETENNIVIYRGD